MENVSMFVLCAVLVVSAPAAAQTYQRNTTDIPQSGDANDSDSENVDFADVDLDGDWDAVFADGGSANDQNRIWINQGGLQGGTLGVFVDQTAARMPAVLDESRDVEFVDFDRDGDPDLHVSNTSFSGPQSNRWLVNQGGAQGGSAGFYVDETSTRWVGLGGPGSSIATSQVLGTGGFRDFSCDSDFGDLDDDGDMDLVHSSAGGMFGGQTPTRIFLNDGQGFFSEFNPAGFQLPGATIGNGDPGLWCEGTQTAHTVDASGAQCDIASSAMDIDLGDLDGDLDLDLVHGAAFEVPRMFQNRLQENGGSLGFRDVTGRRFPAGYSVGHANLGQELGDLDRDGDLDLFGLAWHFVLSSYDHVTLENIGGAFAAPVVVTGTSDSPEEADCVDHDNDGDLDVVVAAGMGRVRLYRNTNDGGSAFGMVDVTGLEVQFGVPRSPRDSDAADVDGDGDYDVWTAAIPFGGTGVNAYLENTSQVADAHAPSLFALEQASDRAAGPAPTVVRVQVYDNAPYYVTWYNATVLEVTVDGSTPFTIPMRSSGGQVFRGEITGRLAGTICYRAISQDAYGNTGASGTLCYQATSSTRFCDASDGSLAACPCANPGNPDTGCDNAQGTGGVGIHVLAQTTGPNAATLVGTGFPALSSPAAIVIRSSSLDPSSPVVFGDGLRCIDSTPLVRLAAAVASGGTSTHAFGHGAGAGAGTFDYQLWYRNLPAAFCTPEAFNLSNGEQLVW